MTILTYLSIYLYIYIAIKKRKKRKKKKHIPWSKKLIYYEIQLRSLLFLWKLIHSTLSNFTAIHVQIFSTSIVHKMLTFKDYYNTINNHSSRTQKYYNFQKWFWKEHSLLAKSTLVNFIRIAFQQNITKHN